MRFAAINRIATVRALPVLLCLCAPLASSAQRPYHNIVNQRFRTIGDGPQSALVVDVPEGADAATVRSAVAKSYAAMRRTRDPMMLKELAAMRRNRQVKPGRQLDVMDFAIVRRGGNLVMNAPPSDPIDPTKGVSTTRAAISLRGAAATRAPVQPLTFSFPTSGANSWSSANATRLVGLANGLIPELTTVLGAPAWTGNVTVLNLDPYLGTVNEILGALFVFDPGSKTYQIDFPTFSDSQSEFLAMAQSMAQAWHGPDLIGYDAWEKGMSRAAAIIAAQDLKTYPGMSGVTIDPANGFYYTPDYDILNEPALGNSTFMPPTIGAETGPSVDPTQFGGMMIPRLEMSGSAWLKCYIENPTFFSTFNSAYYTAYKANSSVANDVNQLRTIAAAALPTGVEGQPFQSWYEEQYVLDTSVTVGAKLYAYTTPTFPSSDGSTPPGAAVYLIYYSTTTSGDETNLNGVSQVVYWDYSFSNRLSLDGYNTVTVSDGFGTVAPIFTGIGGNPADQMRVAMDFPLNKEYVRVYFPAGETGSVATPNTFSGVLVGQDSGAMSVQFTSGGAFTTVNTAVLQGSFGAAAANVGTGFSRTTITITENGTPQLTFKRNLFVRNGDVAPVFSFGALGVTATLQNSFSNGPQMISLPIRPLNPDMATVLGIPPSQALIAQYRQDNTIGPDQYLRYPNLPAYMPGYGLWTDFPSVTTPPAPGILGVPYDPVSQPNVSIGLQYGWNQIGPPYNSELDVTQDVQFQYLGGTVGFLSDAVSNGWVAEGVIAYDPQNGYEDITTTTDPNVPLNQLVPWTGYWINVTVPEGVTMTFLSPASAADRASRALKASRAAKSPVHPALGSWRMPVELTDGKHTSTATIGQQSGASDSYKSAFDTASPPLAPGGATLKLSLPAKQGAPATRGAPGDMMSDMRPIGGKVVWNLTATLPTPKETYTIIWTDTSLVPRGTRLLLVDTTSGAQKLMNGSSGYTFQVGANETSRAFQILEQPRSLGRLSISNVTAVMPPAHRGAAPPAMTISFELSSAGNTAATISLNGRVVRHLAQSGRAADTGINQLTWDMKDDNGRSLAGGVYMLQITAQTQDGEQTRAVAPITIVR